MSHNILYKDFEGETAQHDAETWAEYALGIERADEMKGFNVEKTINEIIEVLHDNKVPLGMFPFIFEKAQKKAEDYTIPYSPSRFKTSDLAVSNETEPKTEKDGDGTIVGISNIETFANEKGVREMKVTFFMLGGKPPMDWFHEFHEKLKKLCYQYKD